MNNHTKTILLLIVSVVVSFAQERRTTPRVEPMDKKPITHQTHSGSFTYNPLRHAGLYIGHLDEENAQFSATLGYQAKPDSIRLIGAPYLSSYRPEKNFFDFYYAPYLVTNSVPYTQKQTLHLFGIGFAVQTDDGFFRFAIDGNAYAGNVKFEGSTNDDDKRLVLGVENFGVSFGWHPEDVLSINLSAYASGFLDTLTVTGANTEDRFSELMVPLTKLSVYLNNKDLPYHMGLDAGYGRRHFVYSTTNPGNLQSASHVENADPIVTDSLAWHTQHQGDIKAGDYLLIQPSVAFGQELTWKKRMYAGQDNYPFNYNGEVANTQWSEKEFVIGGGINILVDDFVNLWFEFDRTSFTGEEATVGIDMDGEIHENNYNRIGFGTTFSAHELPNVDFKGAAFNVDVSFSQTAQRSPYYNSNQFHVNLGSNRTQAYRYEMLLGDYTFNDFSLGLRSSFKDTMLAVALKMGVVKETSALESDIHLGIDLTYNLTSR